MISPHLMDAFRVASVTLLVIIMCSAGVDGDVFVKDLTTNLTIKRYPDLQASFGFDFPPNGLQGWIVYASPDPQACYPVRGPPVNETKCNETVCNYILLVARGGNCQFSDKILAAQNSGYDAVIVHNYPGNNSEVEMQSCANGSLVNIPSTFVGYSSGMALWRYNYTHRKYIITIMEDDLINFPKFLWPFLLAMTVVILVSLVFLLVKLAREHANKKSSRLSRKHLKKIPVRKFKKGDYYDTCAICLDEYEEGEKIRVLPCDHVYHMKCIDPWLTKNKKTCPVCKRRVIPGKDGDSESETEGGRPPTEDSENTPLLSAISGQPRSQSHGSIAELGVSLNPEGSVVQGSIQGNNSSLVDGGAISLLDSDLEHGAVGGEGISDRHQTLLTLAASSMGNIQERDERKDSRSERKRKKKDGRKADENEDPAGCSSLGSESRAEHRERRRLRKEKKKREAENKQKQQGREERVSKREEREVDRSVAQQTEVSIASLAETEDVQMAVGEEAGHDNPSYSDDLEVLVPSAPHTQKMNNVV